MASREALALGSDTRPPVLFRGSYNLWKKRFMDYVERQTNGHLLRELIEKGLAVHKHPTTGVLLTPENYSAEQRDRSAADYRARSYLYQALPDEIYGQVDSFETAKEIWDEVAKQMEGSDMSSTIKLTTILTKFDSFCKKPSESLESVYNRFCTIVNELRKNNVKKEDVELNIKFIAALGPDWEEFGNQVKQNKDLTKFTYHTLYESFRINESQVLRKTS